MQRKKRFMNQELWKKTEKFPPWVDMDIDSYLGQHDIIFNSVPEKWQEGILLGNGDMTANVFMPRRDMIWGIGKVDIFDIQSLRHKHPFHKHKEYLQALEEGDMDRIKKMEKDEQCYKHSYQPFPEPKPAGIFQMFNPYFKSSCKQRLSLAAAEHLLSEDKTCPFSVSSFVAADRNLLFIEMEGKEKISDEVIFTLTGWEYPADKWILKSDRCCGGYQKTTRRGTSLTGHKDNDFWVKRKLPEGMSWVIRVRLLQGGEIVYIDDNVINFSPEKNEKKLSLLISCVTSLEAKDIEGKSKKLLDAAKKEGTKKIYHIHRQWWADFWKKSALNISDKFIENLWYFQNYILASCSRGQFPPSLQSPWQLTSFQGWNGDYHTNQNIEMLYYPPLVSNRLQLGLPFLKTFYNILPVAKKETKAAFEMEGVKYPFSTTRAGEELHSGSWRYEIYVSAWIGELYWRYFQYSQDIVYLENIAYPVLKEIVIFYCQYLQKDENGKYFIYPVQSVEYNNVFVKNQVIDIAFARMIFTFALKAAQKLEKDFVMRSLWKEILDNLPDYPENDGIILAHEGAEKNYLLHHPITLFAPVFPGEEINTDCIDETYKKFKDLFDGYFKRTVRKPDRTFFPFDEILFQQDDIGTPYLSIVAARLGLKELARAYLYDLMILLFLKRNGMFSQINVSGVLPPDRREGLSNMPNIDCTFTTAVNEMMVQSYNGVIRVFPAVPDDWKGGFYNFRVSGGFLVSSRKKGKKVEYISIYSTAGGACKVKSPWSKKLKVTVGKKTVKFPVEKGIITVNTEENCLYLIRQEGTILPESQKLKGKRRENPRIYRGPKYLSKVPENELWDIFLGRPRE
jgi:alpha-L-fucosidase 2